MTILLYTLVAFWVATTVWFLFSYLSEGREWRRRR